jgi:hypothetical protein
MPSPVVSTDASNIGLAEMIESLRSELETSLESGKDKPIAFEVEKVEIELKVAISRSAKGGGGVAFWVVKADANVEAGREATHTFKLVLTPVATSSGTRLRVASRTSQEPTGD